MEFWIALTVAYLFEYVFNYVEANPIQSSSLFKGPTQLFLFTFLSNSVISYLAVIFQSRNYLHTPPLDVLFYCNYLPFGREYWLALPKEWRCLTNWAPKKRKMRSRVEGKKKKKNRRHPESEVQIGFQNKQDQKTKRAYHKLQRTRNRRFQTWERKTQEQSRKSRSQLGPAS